MLKKFSFLVPFIFIVESSLAQEKQPFFQDIETSSTYSADIFSNLWGGLETGTRFMDNINIDLNFDILDFSFYVNGLGNQGKSISEIVGDIQSVSNIDTDNSWRLYEAWIHKSIPKFRSSLLVGLYDLNSEFDVINTGGLYLNSSHGIGPDFSSSGITGPSIFPLTSLSARLKVSPIQGISFKVAILDAVPSNPNNTTGTSVLFRNQEGVLLVSELEISKSNGSTKSLLERGINVDSPYRVAFGAWKYSQERNGWLGTPESDHGVYSLAEFTLNNGISFFGRVGFTNRDINRYNGYLGGGISYLGLVPSREEDQVGIAFARTYNSNTFVAVESQRGNDFLKDEFNIELTYLIVISNHVSFQIDTQYIQHPNQAPKIANAFTVGLRSVFEF